MNTRFLHPNAAAIPPSRRRRRNGTGRRSGQTMVFLLMVIVALVFIVLWNFDLHKILSVKLRSQNAGDAAALAAARWQGATLNLIGHLNVLQAVALMDALLREDGDWSEARLLADLQARLCYVGPLIGFSAAQQAAKQNNMYVNAAFTSRLSSHARSVIQDYPMRFGVPPYENSPSPPTAWDDYAQMLMAIAANGVAADAENVRRYTDYANHNHLLLNPSFYDAIASRDWCWFFFNALAELRAYGSWRDWPPLPVITQPEPMNSEYFGLHLMKAPTLETLPGLSRSATRQLLDELERLSGRSLSQEVARVETDWFAYRPSDWGRWTDFIPADFPFEGRVKAEYDYLGADAAVRVETHSTRLTPGSHADAITWTAAAKPFGFLEGPVPPNRWGLVLPAFHEVRLIPVDTSTAGAGGSRPGWAEHLYDHLPRYVERGPEALVGGCFYCAQLRTWENDDFRRAGLEWIEEFSAGCRRPTGGGPGSSGGTRRGH
jgi:hypothetical protein